MLLQLSFLVSVPPENLTNGWHSLILTAHGGPIVALAMGVGLTWMVTLLLIDAVVSPGATALTYVGVSARISWMMGECGLVPRALGQLKQGYEGCAAMDVFADPDLIDLPPKILKQKFDSSITHVHQQDAHLRKKVSRTLSLSCGDVNPTAEHADVGCSDRARPPMGRRTHAVLTSFGNPRGSRSPGR